MTENKQKIKTQIKKGVLEFCVLLIIENNEVYASNIIEKLRDADMIIVEGTLYPLLSRLKREELVKYEWIESESGPPRKYYKLTTQGEKKIITFKIAWEEINNSINILNT